MPHTSGRGYLKFNLSGVTGGSVTSAILRLYCTSIEGTPASVQAYTCTTDSWTETGITYNNKPAKGTLITTVNIPSAGAWYSFNVTSFVNGQYAGDKIVTIILAQDSTVKKNVYFNSKEAASNQAYPRSSHAIAQLPQKGGAVLDNSGLLPFSQTDLWHLFRGTCRVLYTPGSSASRITSPAGMSVSPCTGLPFSRFKHLFLTDSIRGWPVWLMTK